MKGLITCLCIVSAFHASAKPLTGPDLLDKVISHPGSYSQVCDVMMAKSEIPYRAFTLSDANGASFSQANLRLMEANREAVITATRARLLAIDFTKNPTPPKEDPLPEENNDGSLYGNDPTTLNPLLLALILELKATEALPELLAVEEKLVQQIAAAKENASAPVPLVDGWFVAEEPSADEEEKADRSERHHTLFQARNAQRDLVIIMQMLLRDKKYPPALKDSIETAYQKKMQALAKEEGWEKFLPSWSAADDEMEYIEKSPSGVYHKVERVIEIPYTRESRDEVRAVAEQWVKEHP